MVNILQGKSVTETFVEESEDDGKYSSKFGNFSKRIEKPSEEDKVVDFKGEKGNVDDDKSVSSETSSSTADGEVGIILP